MPPSKQQPLPPMEVTMLHRDAEARAEAVKDLHCVPLALAKAKVGAAISAAIGSGPRKAYGHEGLVSGVCSGEKVPGYLARMYQDKGTRRRFALALLNDDSDVIITTVVTVPMSKAG